MVVVARSPYIYAYNNNSKSAHAIAKGVGARIIRQVNSTFTPGKSKIIINWGSGKDTLKEYSKAGSFVVNMPDAVNTCSDKANFFKALDEVSDVIPEWTTDQRTAIEWHNAGTVALGRTSRRSKGGEGIYFSDVEEDLDHYIGNCSLWTKYVPKAKEFRVHIVQGDVIDVTEKKLRKTDDNGVEVDKEKINWRVRSHSNGFIFAREGIRPADAVIHTSKRVFDVLHKDVGLNFGAFDVIYNQKHDRAVVLEVNTAPGVEGTTLDKYVSAFKDTFKIGG